MLRRVVKAKRFKYADCRNMTRHDQGHFDWLLGGGFFAVAGDGTFEVTDRGKAAADLGMYDWEPGAMPQVKPKRSK
jgi:hypothetical protein